MKLALIVADGVHKGKAIPVNVPQFLIGRDPHCQLRPASQAISKQHCAILMRADQVFVKDFGSTNGTYVNDERVEGEREIKNGDALKAGPLAFTVKLEVSVAAAPAKVPVATKPGSNPQIAQKPPAKAKPLATETESTAALDSDVDLSAKKKADDDDGPRSDKFAAMLLGGDDDATDGTSDPQIPEGSTVMDLPALEGKPEVKKGDVKAEQAANSNVAADILKKYMRRPRA